MPMNAPNSLTETQDLAVLELVLERRGVDFARPLVRADTATIRLSDVSAATLVITVPPAPRPIGTPISHPAPTPTPVKESAGTTNPSLAAPVLTDSTPGPSGDVSPCVVWFEIGPFKDSDVDDRQTATEFEVFDTALSTPDWRATLDGPITRVDLRSGTFLGPLTGRLGLEMGRVYPFRARASGDRQADLGVEPGRRRRGRANLRVDRLRGRRSIKH